MENLLFKNAGLTLEIKEIGDEYVHLEGLASTFGNIDRSGDIIAIGAFEQTLTKRMPKLLNQHDMRQPIGVIDMAAEVQEGLFIKCRLPKANSMVMDMLPLLKMGALGDFSIGFNVVDSETTPDGNRIIKEIDLWEVSIVTIPANPKAKITSVKSAVPFKDLPLADRGRAWDSTTAIARVRKLTNSGESPSETYKNAFLWYDSENAENFTAYKLPIADVIDGKLTAIPRGIFAAAAALRGARGGVNIPEGDKQTIINNINKYYDKMGIDSPFNKSESALVGLEDAEQISTKREFEALLMETGYFTRKACITLAARFNEGQSDFGKSAQRDSVNEGKLLKEAMENLKKTLTKE